MKIAIAGAAGRMGQALIRAAGSDMTIVGGTERPGSSDLGRDIGDMAGQPASGARLTDQVAAAAASADVWIDFTLPPVTLDALDALKATPVKAAILGATGWTPEQDAAAAVHAARIPVVKAGNFSLGMNLLLGLVEQAAARLGPDWDIEISETHHRRKIDAPSGAALMIGEAAARGRGAALSDLRIPPHDGMTGPRPSGAIAFAVTRAGGVIGDHEAAFASDEEILTIGHRALDRAIFAKGALHAARWALGRPPGLYTMRDVLGL